MNLHDQLIQLIQEAHEQGLTFAQTAELLAPQIRKLREQVLPPGDAPPPPNPIPSDTLFSTHPANLYEPQTCSRCHQTLEPDDTPIRITTVLGSWEYRFHRKCLFPSEP